MKRCIAIVALALTTLSAHAQEGEEVLVPPPEPEVLTVKEPLRLTLPETTEAPAWLAVDADATEELPIACGEGEVLARSDSLGLVRVGPHIIAIHRTDGVLGALRTPVATRWMGIDVSGRLIAIAEGGAVAVAQTLGDAMTPGGFKPLITLPGLRDADLTPTHIVGVTPSQVLVYRFGDAKNEPRLGEHALLGEGFTFTEVAARTDGVFAALVRKPDGSKATYHGRFTGKRPTLVEATVDLERLERVGDWIGDLEGLPTVLADDGKTWLVRMDPSPLWEDIGYTELVCASATPSGSPWQPSHTRTSPAPLAANTPPTAKGMGMGGQGMGGLGRYGRCQDTICVSRVPFDLEPLYGSPRFAFLSDGACADERCEPFTRPPSVAVMTATDFTRRNIPEACTNPAELIELGGLAVLTCEREAYTDLFVTDARSDWHFELAIQSSPNTYLTPHMTEDGALHLLACEGSCALHMRRAEPVGTEAAWSVVATDIDAWRPLPRGAAMGLTSDGRIWHHNPAHGTTTLGTPIAIPSGMTLQEIERTTDGCVRAQIDSTTRKARWYVVATDGTLTQHTTCADATAAWDEELQKGTLSIACEEESTLVRVGLVSGEGIPVDAGCPVELRLPPGEYRVAAAASEHQPVSQNVTIETAQTAEITFDLPREPVVAVRLYGGIPFGAADDPAVLLGSINYLIDPRAVDVGAFARYFPNTIEDALLVGVTARVMGSFHDLDVGLALSLGWGNIEGRADDADPRTNQKSAIRFSLGLRGAFRLIDTLRLEAAVDAHIAEPTILDVLLGLSYAF